TAMGVIVMRLSDGSFINNVARLEREEEIEQASEAIDKEIAEAAPTEQKKEEDSSLDSLNEEEKL
ncbi:MAG: hypothetical protein J6U68_01880, partial [Clostridia bacterium]|nr:hypothetical protein [Clostridia bacterium]